MRFALSDFASRLTETPRWLFGLTIIGAFLLHPLAGIDVGNFLARLEAIAYDTRLKFTLPGTPDPQVVIIDIDEASLQRDGRWPWSRDKLARLTEQLFDRYQVRAIGFDVFFPEPDRSSGIDTLAALARGELRDDISYIARLAALRQRLDFDQRFADAMHGRSVVLGFGFVDPKFSGGAPASGELPAPAFSAKDLGGGSIPIRAEAGYTANLPLLQQAAIAGGHIDPVFDADNIVRRVPLVKLYGDDYYPALSLAVARVALEAKSVVPKFGPDNRLDAFDVGGLPVPVGEDGSALIPFRGPPRTFRYYSASNILAGTAPTDFVGTIALVGTSSKGLQDLRATPLAADFPGVEVHANLIAGMLNGELKAVPAYGQRVEALMMLFAGLLVLFVIPYRRPVSSTLGVAAVMLVLTAANLLLWIKQNEVIPLAATLMMLVVLLGWNMLAGFLREARKIRRVSAMFGEYVPKERVAQMVESGQRYSMAGESRDMTVLFCDVRDFTALSENLQPRELSAMMYAYLTPMTALIHASHGTIDKYVGDSIMAFWGAPIDNPHHARDGVEAALAMQRKIAPLMEEFARRGWPALSIGIGLNSGAMNVGDMGSEFRKAYTVLGDAVNLASRLEGLNKEYGVGIIAGEDTRVAVPGVVWREIDRVRVKGRARPVTIYEPLDGATSAAAEELVAWDDALKMYRGRRFDEAGHAFAALAATRHSRLYELYRMRCTTFRAEPPPIDWDGATAFISK